MMKFKLTPIQPPTSHEKIALRLLIFIGVISVFFFLYSLFDIDNISYLPLYVLLMITMVYYCAKFLHEWYHYFSISADQRPVPTKIYSVDVLTTYCAGEPFDMLEQTLTAIQQITYPHTAWCCDEANDPSVKQLCHRLGVNHVTRVIKKDAKAGNINNALQFATGELCLVLDPDHIPAPEFLDEVAAYFDDESIGFVQVVQAYYNHGESMVAKGAAQQTYQFYGPMMMAMHKYGTVQAIGANCTFRRKALNSIGGHASGLSEDMHTAMQLHAKGWKSVYVPSILTRGLVPATMSSYYKQQLKWSRGTWELLVKVYPKLYSNFTWRQKIHYLTLPFHYLSGFIFFINFLIPIVCLITGYIPLKMDLVSFLLATLPMLTMSVLIRHYVQKWVAEEKERGFHLVGGILQIGTWWIHSVGFIYTLFRKKVPYIPTPKNDNDPLPLSLSLPNIMVAVISLAAIIYGLWHDYNPYTIFMVVLAAMQIGFMVFILSISGHISTSGKLNDLATRIQKKTWLIVKAHGFLRRYSMPLALVVIIAFMTGFYFQHKLPTFLPKKLPGLEVFYKGLYQSPGNNGDGQTLTAIALAEKREDIAIIRFDIPWGAGEVNKLDTSTLKKVYILKAVPLLAWQPWQKSSTIIEGRDTSVFQHIISGQYDSLVLSFAEQVALLKKPVYLGYDNNIVKNKYPLFAPQDCDPGAFIMAWRHVHHLFKKAGADNVIWIWNPWDPTLVNDFYPGRNYVDWLGIDITVKHREIRSTKYDNSGLDFDYRPYHELSLFREGLPVIITKTTGHSVNTSKWWNATWNSIDTAFKEIKSVIVGGAVNGDGLQPESQLRQLPLSVIFGTAPNGIQPLTLKEITWRSHTDTSMVYRWPDTVKATGYDKGYHWFRNRHTLTMKTIENDISSMKELGINTIERTMPGFYDDNIGKVLISKNMKLIPRFSVLKRPEDIFDEDRMATVREKILEVVKNNLGKEHIISWSLGEDVLFTLGNQTFKPDYFYYQQKYITWLSELCRQIRKIDTERPIVMDLHWDVTGAERYQFYKQQLPLVNTYLLVADAKYSAGLSIPLQEGMAWGKVDVSLWPLLPPTAKPGMVPEWQDIENTDYVGLNGLLNIDGRKKVKFGKVAHAWGKQPLLPSPVPDIKILKPSQVTRVNTTLKYHILYQKYNSGWKLYKDDEDPETEIQWYLVRTDQYGNTMFIKKAGKGTSLTLSIPLDPEYYKLYVEARVGNDIKTFITTLNTPLY